MAASHKGSFRPKNKDKYRGNSENITYRSGWELSCMMKFDNNPNVLEWSSETVVVPYRSEVDRLIEQRTGRRKIVHKYFIDFYVKLKQKDGKTVQKLIEVKPYGETIEPDRKRYKGRNAAQRYATDVKKWLINKAKWTAAKTFAANRGMDFEIYTEKKIYGQKDN